MRYTLKTFGCQMNYSDSERVSRVLDNAGFEKSDDEKNTNLIVINTCSVRQKSEDKALGFMTQLKRDHPKVKIAVTGCMVRQTGDKNTSRDELLRLEPIDFVFRIEDAARLPKMLEPHFPEHDFSDFAKSFGSGTIENYFHINPKVENKSQVFVPIMQGCDKFCTYCIVPYTRGREISRPMEEIFLECQNHVQNGAKEITLLGQNVNSYTNGGNSSKQKVFAQLLQKIDTLHEAGLSRIRFTSPHPQDFTDDVIEALATMKTACPYIHLPVQHGSNNTLRAMNRNYRVEDFEKIVEKIRAKIPDCTLATDIIVGFPGETDQDFKELCTFARRMKFDFSYTAIFSPRRNTPAARMKSDFVPDEVKKKRFHHFDKIIKESAFARREEYVGETLEVLVEKSEPFKGDSGEKLFRNAGRSREFFEVSFISGRPLTGKEVSVEATKLYQYTLNGKLKEGVEKKEMKVL